MIKIDGSDVQIEGKGDEIITDVGLGFWTILKSIPEVITGLKVVAIPTILDTESTTIMEKYFLLELQELLEKYSELFQYKQDKN